MPNKTMSLYRHAKEIIPGGTQLLSKRPEMFAPDVWPAYFQKAEGCRVWDLDGRPYVDMTTNGIGACLLGFAHPEVTEAVVKRVRDGSMCTLNAPEEVELADRMLALHPWAEQARFARSGGEIGAVAARIARATTDRDKVAICGYHGWHDWYLSANLGSDDSLRGHLLPGLAPFGVPRKLNETAMTFQYNDIEAFDAIMDTIGTELACVIMEPVRHSDPAPGFLEHIREETARRGILLIFDEITIGFRLCLGGSHLKYGVVPDMAIFAKALGNGHPIAAVIGTRKAMEGANVSFISSTYWTESVGPTAALATLRVMEKTDVPAHIENIGRLAAKTWGEASQRHKLPVTLHPEEFGCLALGAFAGPKAKVLKTLFTTLMLDKGYLADLSIYPTLAHTPAIVDEYAVAVDDVFREIAGIPEDTLEQALKGPVCHSGFKRLN